MGWYFRKSMNMGGLRLNFSKSGVGASVGVRGFRYGISPNGRRYVRCGMDGIYYQKTLGSGAVHRSQFSQPSPANRYPSDPTLGQSQTIASADASSIADSTSADFVKELQERLRTPQWHLWCMIPGAAILLAGVAESIIFLVVSGAIALVGGGIGGFVIYRAKRTTAVKYDLDPAYGQRFGRLLSGFEQLCKSERLWIVEGTSAVSNAKYHAGAGSILARRGISVRLGAPDFLHLNLNVPIILAGRQSLYFLPDVVLVVQGNHVGAVSYSHLNVFSDVTRYIEDGSAPRDSEQVGTTWRFVNKSGGPDRRFADNRQIPILKYAELRFQSSTGLNEVIHVSNVRSASAFAEGVRSMIQFPSNPGSPGVRRQVQ
jgi:Protein of unknown function (DUF4236)